MSDIKFMHYDAMSSAVKRAADETKALKESFKDDVCVKGDKIAFIIAAPLVEYNTLDVTRWSKSIMYGTEEQAFKSLEYVRHFIKQRQEIDGKAINEAPAEDLRVYKLVPLKENK